MRNKHGVRRRKRSVKPAFVTFQSDFHIVCVNDGRRW